jgi:hypothetical protein
MKKIAIIITGLVLAANVSLFAQEDPAKIERKDKREVLKKDIKADKKEIKEEKAERNADLKAGKTEKAEKETKEIRAERKDVRKDRVAKVKTHTPHRAGK